MIRKMIESDGPKVLEIYKMGIDSRNATFETSVPTWMEWNTSHLQHSRLVYENNGMIFGWAALSPVSARAVYKGVAELSIYLNTDFIGKGIGSLLMQELILSSEENGIWTIASSVFPENKITIALHLKHGFRIIGSREKIAMHDGRWRDSILLERRSKTIGA
jgi:L-amino acid N-acyltransferase YncA